MAKHVISVCIFCFICATHSPCASHAAVSHENTHKNDFGKTNGPNNPPLIQELRLPSREKFKEKIDPNISSNNINRLISTIIVSPKDKRNSSVRNLVRRNVNDVNGNTTHLNNSAKLQDEDYLKKIFTLYGDGNSMNMEGFERLIKRLDLLQVLSMKLDTSLSNTTGVDDDLTTADKLEHSDFSLNSSVSFSFYKHITLN